MKHIMRFFLAGLILIVGTLAGAKDLTYRLGVGYADPFSLEMPSLHLRYWASQRTGFSLSLGVDTEEDQSRFGLMAKGYRVIFTEDNLNFYMGSGVGVISREATNGSGSVESDTGFELTGFCGAEFFLPGLENVGFSFEAGIGVTSIGSEVRFRTIGESPLKAGMAFYF